MRSPRPDQVHDYQYTGILLCGECTRQMEGTWNNGSAAYRCQHGHFSANSPIGRTSNAYIRESHLLARKPLLHIRLTHDPALPTVGKGRPSSPGAPKRITAIPRITTPTPEEVIAQLRRSARTLTYHHPTKTLEVSGKLPIRITV